MYLMIENRGVADVGSFTLLGASTARQSDSTIGQFGSGAKHGLLVLMRACLEFVVCLGTTRVSPETKKQIVNGESVDVVNFRVGNKLHATSLTLGFGERDWSDNVDMALREIISNALDAVDGKWSEIRLEVVERIRARKGYTRVFVQFDARVRKYLNGVSSHFLHVYGEEKLGVLSKTESGKARLYRMGVFVRESAERQESIFDYNAKADLEIDESRNLDSWRMPNACAEVLTNGENQDKLRTVLRKLSQDDSTTWFESRFSKYWMSGDNLLSAFKAEFGDNAKVEMADYFAERARAKGLTVVMLPAAYYEKLVEYEDTLACTSVLKGIDSLENHEETTTTETCLDAVKKVWGVLEDLKMTKGREFPVVRQFVSTMEQGSQMYGFWTATEPDKIWLHDEHSTNVKTILEELVHYISHARDETRDFQDFVLRVCGRMIDKR